MLYAHDTNDNNRIVWRYWTDDADTGEYTDAFGDGVEVAKDADFTRDDKDELLSTANENTADDERAYLRYDADADEITTATEVVEQQDDTTQTE